jgi:hypothetical protein
MGLSESGMCVRSPGAINVSQFHIINTKSDATYGTLGEEALEGQYGAEARQPVGLQDSGDPLGEGEHGTAQQ